MSTKPPSKSVFIGNIPYGLTEEQIIDIFGSAGKVLSFRLVYDRETGKPKGFGFAEYPDSDSAASAVRNLNDYDIMGRKLRVDFSNDGGEEEGVTSSTYAPPQNGLATSTGAATSNGSLPPLPQGVDLPPGLTCPDAISRTLSTLPPAQLLDVLSQMKNLVSADAEKATELLRQAPQLSYAIFQALLLMGLVSSDALNSVVETAITAPAPAPPVVQVPTPVQQGYPPPIPGQSFPGGFPPPPPQFAGQMGTPQPGMPFPPPPPQYRQQSQTPVHAAPPAPPGAAGDTEALIKQVLEMPQSLIDQLPPSEKAQIIALRQQFLGGR